MSAAPIIGMNATNMSTPSSVINVTNVTLSSVTPVTLMINASLLLANVTPPATSPPARTGTTLKCVPKQLADRYTPERLALIKERLGLDVCKPNQSATEQKNRDSVENYPQYHVTRWINIYRYYILIPVAVIFNGLLFLTVVRRMAERSAYFNMGMLAIWDTTSIVLRGLHNILTREGVIIFLEGCRFFNFTAAMAGIVANWILVAWTVERALVVTMPLRFAAVRGIKAAVISNIVIVIVACGIKVRTLFTGGHKLQFVNGYNRSQCGPLASEVVLNEAFLWVDSLAYSILPLILVFAFNCVIMVGLARATAKRESLKEGHPQKGAGPKRNNAYHQRQVTIMLVAASIAFAVLTLPTVIYFGMGKTHFSHLNPITHPKPYSDALLVRTVAQLLTDINHCINFFLYVLASRGFRRDLESFFCRRAAVKGGTFNSTTGSTAISSRKVSTRL